MQSLKILYRDQWLIAVDKPAGMLVHPGDSHSPGESILMKVLRDQINFNLWAVHRLDQPTSGVVIFSLFAGIDTYLKQQFERQEARKNYRAVAVGETPDSWTKTTPLQKDINSPAQESQTQFRLKHHLQINQTTVSVLQVTPKTGRFHQIRKHLADSGFPIVGDYRYGDAETMDHIAANAGQSGLMLHSTELQLTHPVTSEDLFISSPLPERFAAFRQLPDS